MVNGIEVNGPFWEVGHDKSEHVFSVGGVPFSPNHGDVPSVPHKFERCGVA